MAIDTAKLLSKIDQRITQIKYVLEKKILNGFIRYNPTNSDANAIKKLRNSIGAGRDDGYSIKNIPDDVYTAFATMINNDLAGSKIKKLSTNDVKRTNQIFNALKAGIKHKKTQIPLNGTNYNIEYNIIAYAGIGTSSADVRWKDKNKKNCHIIFYWDNVGTKQGTQALAEYCSLLKDLDLELWKNFFKKVLNAGAKSWIVENYGTQIMNAINDKIYAKKFLNDLEFYDKELKANNFGQFISDNVTDGELIVSAAKLLKTLESKKNALVNVIDNDKKIESKLKDFAKTCNQLETKLGLEKSDFSIDEFTILDVINKKNNITITGTKGNDSIENCGKKVTIKAGAGNDSIKNYSDGENVKIFGENGNDTIYNFKSNVTISSGNGNDLISSYWDNVTISGGNGNDSIHNNGDNVTISGGNGNDYIGNIGDNATISGGNGNDTITAYTGDNTTISGGKGNDLISIESHYMNSNIIQYAKGDGKDTVEGFDSDDTLQITKGSYKVSTKNNDVIVKDGSGSITLKDAKGQQISIKDSKGKVTTKTYGSSSANVAELFAENNFATADNLSEIVKNNLTTTDYKIETNNFENLTQENNLITFAEK